MDCMDFRESGELSDICIIVDDKEFNLHKFPLFVRSNYFKNTASKIAIKDDKTDKLTLKLENFPGGAKTFALIADYCYNKEIHVDSNNVLDVKCGAEYLEMNSNGKGGLCMFVDNILFDLLYVAKAKRDFKLILQLIEDSIKHKDIVEKCKLNLRLLDAFVEYVSLSIKLNGAYNCVKNDNLMSDDEIRVVNNLPLNWFLYIIKSKVHIGSYIGLLSYFVENYIDYNTGLNPNYKFDSPKAATQVLKPLENVKQSQETIQPLLQPLQIDVNTNTTSKNDDNLSLIKTSSPAMSPIPDVQSSILNTTQKNDDKTDLVTTLVDSNLLIKSKLFSDDEKLVIIRDIAVLFNESYIENQLKISWLLIYMTILNKLNADDNLKEIFLKWIWNSFNNFKKITNEEFNNIPADIMIQLIKNFSTKDDQNFDKLINLTDQYLNELLKNKKLSTDIFIDIAKSIPADKRNSFDNLTTTLLTLIEKDNFNLPEAKKQELLDIIDFHKLNETTLELCKNCELIPKKYITEAALALCIKLRKELDEQKLIVKSLELTTSSYPRTKTPHLSASTLLLNELYKPIPKNYTNSVYDNNSTIANPLLTNKNKESMKSPEMSTRSKSKASSASSTTNNGVYRKSYLDKKYNFNNSELTLSDDDGYSLDDHYNSSNNLFENPNQNNYSSYYDDLLYSKDYYYLPTYYSGRYRPTFISSSYYDDLKYKL